MDRFANSRFNFRCLGFPILLNIHAEMSCIALVATSFALLLDLLPALSSVMVVVVALGRRSSTDFSTTARPQVHAIQLCYGATGEVLHQQIGGERQKFHWIFGGNVVFVRCLCSIITE